MCGKISVMNYRNKDLKDKIKLQKNICDANGVCSGNYSKNVVIYIYMRRR